jgi:histidinol phosphatase-like enzyme (inositol monophosphatase family)
MNYASELATALNCAQKTGKIQLQSQRSRLSIEKKADTSPVTDIDRACEATIRDLLIKAYPNDSFLGEETGLISGSSQRCWIVDPLDGTRPFIRGIPTYSTLIALEDNKIPVVGVIHLPALATTCWASYKQGAFCNGKPIHVSTTALLNDAMGSALGFIEHSSATVKQQLLSCMQSWNYAYGFMDAFSYVCCAEGKLDLCVNILDKPWDCAAAACIIKEAGGTFSDIQGEETISNGSIIFSNTLLHQQILDFFRSRFNKKNMA